MGVALLGFGNVGQGAFRILTAHAEDIQRRLGARVRVRHVLVRDARKARGFEDAGPLLTTDYVRVLSDPDVHVVVELMGGVEAAFEHVSAAIRARKQVVTANKALLSARGEALFEAAAAAGVDLAFEGAVCGGVPVIRTLREALAADRVQAVSGIVNGTTNFILGAMSGQGRAFADALAEAQALGFAEADPTLDVSGMDAAQKICLLAQLAFGARVSASAVHVEGITRLEPEDFELGRELGFVIKLLATARRVDGALDVRVHPAFLPAQSALAQVGGGFNAVQLECAALGPAFLSGRGAGALPTGSAVVSDVMDVCRNLLGGVSGRLPALCAPFLQELPLLPMGAWQGRHYLRFTVQDTPGVLARIAGVLAEKEISIASVVQRSAEGQGPARIVVLTHEAPDAAVASAVAWIDQLVTTRAPTQHLRVESGPRPV
jgi:homoserine dehydrogenase